MKVIALVLLLIITAHVVARWAGLGMCFICGSPCVLTDDRCWRHKDQALR